MLVRSNMEDGAYPALDNRFNRRYDKEVGGQDLRQFVAMLLRRRRAIAAGFLLVMAVGILTTWMTRPIYQAGATILVSTASRGGGNEDVPFLNDFFSNSQTRKLETQIEILKSAPVQKGALGRLSAVNRQALSEYSSTTFKPVRNTDVVAITTQSYSPSAAAAMVNAISAEYIEQSREQNRGQVRVATKYVEDQLKIVQGRLDQASTALKKFKQQYQMADMTTEIQQITARLGSLESGLEQAEMQSATTAAQLGQLRSAAAKIAPEITSTTIVARPVVEALKEQLTKLELERLAVLQTFTPASLEVRNIDGQIKSITDRLRTETATQIGDQNKTANPVWQQTTQEIIKTQSDYWAAQARAQALRATAVQARARLAQLPEREYRFSQLTTDVAAQQQTYQMLNEQYQTLRISLEARTANASILSTAAVPGSPISPRKGQNLMMFVWLGLIIALALAALLERLDDHVHTDEDAENASHLPVLTHVPFIKDSTQQSLLTQYDQPSVLLESYRMLGANLVFSAIDGPLRLIALTSSQPSEGKSISSVNLAIVTALSGQSVILVDCDLRRPSLHRLMRLSNRIGFTSVVTGLATLDEALQDTPIPGLRVLTSGPLPPNPPELLHSQAGRACIRKLAELADFVVIDSPPALSMADAQFVASMVDGVLLVVSAQEAGKREVARTRQILAQTGTKLLGVVLNKVSLDFGSYYGYKYRYYGDYHKSNGTQNEENALENTVKTAVVTARDANESKNLPSVNGESRPS